ncbi:MAG: GTPase HflX [Candidatus Wallbacteria bacterium]|nr:GTPase HflX [Candidatus Wallbacteria bacterium]
MPVPDERQTSEPDRAILVALRLPETSREDLDDEMKELGALCQTLGTEVADQIIQARPKPDPSTFIGRGKALEIRDRCKRIGANSVIFDEDLSPGQVKNLEKVMGLPVRDRCGVILDIFASRARTYESKLQVELAQMEYVLPRLTHQWSHLSRQIGGGKVQRGIGEKQLELDRRYVRNRIAVLKERLSKVEQQRETRRRAREENFRVAIVGYTNSGKSTLMNRLTDSRLLVEDKLFATLDSSIRAIVPGEKPPILLSDTVGFIRKLPHSLVASFRSTFEEAGSADLLLDVVDLTDARFKEKMEASRAALKEFALDRKPYITVFNKIDLLPQSKLPVIVRSIYPSAVCVSAVTGDGLEELRRRIYGFFEDRMVDVEMAIDYDQGSLINRIFQNARISSIEYHQDRIVLRFRTTKTEVSRIQSRLNGRKALAG